MAIRGWQFVNSWGYSWMAIREFVGLRGWQFVGLFVDGNSWVFVDDNAGDVFWGGERWAGTGTGRVQDPRRTRPAPYETRAVRDPRRTRDGRVQDPRRTRDGRVQMERWAGARPAPY